MNTTPITLPKSTLFPVEITQIISKAQTQVKKHDTIARFKYWHEVEEGDERVSKELYSSFEAPVAGTIHKWEAAVGDLIDEPGRLVVHIQELCTHPVQYGGLCAMCGESAEQQDYSDFHLDRAPISMSHENTGLRVSYDEAARIEKTSLTRLLSEKKLILVVDLDQTVIHADVDKTIGEWMQDETNPNHEAVKDIRTFQLEEDVMNNETRRISRQWCTYYVKLRPGLQGFLKEMSKLYELHVYTMATKSYAQNIIKLIDPDGKYFADRVLSRDDSGSTIEKHLKRLFPVSTSMVAIIDDRGDVWKWTPHLLRVVPYNFFRIGDINSSFLPKQQGLVEPKKPAGDATTTNTPAEEERSAILGEQMNERPLAKLEEEQWKREEKEAEESHETPKHEQVLLEDLDNELVNVERALKQVHSTYYEQYDPIAPHEPNIEDVMRQLKEPVFDGCVMLFTGIVPIGTNLENADIVRWVRSFGAVVVADYHDKVTHVVASNAGTRKVQQASRNPDVKIVGTNWLFACIAKWQHVPEEPFLLKVAQDARFDEEEKEQKDEDDSDPNIDPEKFMQQLNDGQVNWNEISKEVDDFIGSSDDDDEEDDDDDEQEDDDSRKRDREPETQGETSRKKPKVNVEDANGSVEKLGEEADQPDGNDDDDDDNDQGNDDYDEDEFAKELGDLL